MKKLLLSAIIMLALQPTVYAMGTSTIFDEFIDPSLAASTDIRINQMIRKGSENVADIVAANYEYNTNRKITRRDYLDSTFTYEYNGDGTLKKVTALMKPASVNAIIRHTTENFTSEYTYNDGRVSSENKKIFSSSITNLDGEPEASYNISYRYNTLGKLDKRVEKGLSNKNIILYTYSFNDNGQLSKINEERKTGKMTTDRDILLLTYNDSGEITKAIHKKPLAGNIIDEPPVIKTVDIVYNDNDNDVYPFYYVDPVKEWKVDRDFFGLSYHRIRKITITIPSNIIEMDYTYQDTNNDFLPDSLSVTMKMTQNGSVIRNEIKQYQLIYPQE